MTSTTVVFPNITTVTYNDTLASLISGTTVSPSAPGTFVFKRNNNAGATLTSSSVYNVIGNYTIYCAFTSSNTGNFKSSNGSKTVTVQKATPTITMSSTNSITYGTTMSGFITGTTASIAGSFTFRINDAAGQILTSASVLNAATYTIFCAFTPTDTTNYNSTTATKSLTVTQLSSTVTLSSTNSITYGTTMSGFISSTTASIAGSFTFRLNDASGQLLTSASVPNAATYTIFCAFTPTDTNYASSTATKSLTVTQLSSTVTLSSTNSITYGTTMSGFISSTTASVAGSFSFRLNDASGELLTSTSVLNAATYTIFCAFSPTDTTNYNSSTATKSLTVNKSSTTITLSSTNTFAYGTTMASFISGTTASVAGSFSFRLNDASGQLLTSASVLNTAIYTIFCAFTPTDTTNYNSSTATKSLTVTKLSSTVTLSSTNSITYGTTMNSFISSTTASVAGSFSFRLNDASGQLLTSASLLNAATYTIFCAFTPTDTTNYNSSTATKSLTVNKSSTAITMSPMNIFAYGTTMASFMSSTTASVAGSFSFRLTNVSGQLLTSATVLNAGTYTIFAAFTPTDTTNYNSSTATKSLTVHTLQPNIVVPASNSITYGTNLTNYMNSVTAFESSLQTSVPGTFVYYLTYSDGFVLETLTPAFLLQEAVNYIDIVFTPSDTTNYLTAELSTILYLLPQTPTIILSSLNTLVYGSTFASFVSGTTAYITRMTATNTTVNFTPSGVYKFYLNDASGQLLTSTTVLNSGTYTIFCTFNANDKVLYGPASASKSLTVQKATPTITLSSLNSITYGTTMASFISGTTVPVAGSFNFYLTNALGQLLTSATILNVATYTIFCAFTPTDTANYNSSTASKSLTVNIGQVNLTYTIPDSINTIPYGTQLSAGHLSAIARDSQTNAIVTGKQFTYTFTPDYTQIVTPNSILNSGTYYLFATFTDPSNNYASKNTFSTRTTILTVTKVKSTVTVPNVSSIVYGTTMDSFISGTTKSVPGSLRFYTPQ